MSWTNRLCAIGLAITTPLAQAAQAAVASEGNAKPASAATRAFNQRVAGMLPADDGRDDDFSKRGFIATRADPIIRAADGHMVWDLSAYSFLTGPSPATVNPSLWRYTRYLARNGLFKVAEGVWQVRGFDNSNMTILRGATGWIVIDPLVTREAASAAMDLVNANLGKRPVSAVIYSHSHPDHFGGVEGVISPQEAVVRSIPILALSIGVQKGL